MSVLFENLHVGEWYALHEVEEDDAPVDFNPFAQARSRHRYDGLPFQVTAVSHPFILGRTMVGVAVTYDTRIVRLVALLPGYVREWKKIMADTNGAVRVGPYANKPALKKRKRKEKPDPHRCPRCGCRFIQRLRDVKDGWHYACRDCGFDAGPVPKD
jgi:predicted RNA-binding Zn-ribbon protein involved in translation (DUF1610 family)